MASRGLDEIENMCDIYIFYGTHFARWKHHMLDHFRELGPKFWWVVTSGLTHVLDHKILTKAQKVLYELDAHACCFILDTLRFDLMKEINYTGTAHEI